MLTVELFELHDRERFEIYGFDWSREDGTPLRQRVIAAMDHFERIHELSDEAAARLIRRHEIDILVDLQGQTLGARAGMLAWQPAPVQITYLGLPATTGLPFIDHVIADRFLIPEPAATYYSEIPLYLPDVYQVSDRQRQHTAPPRRTDCGLPEGAFVFCSFNNNYKNTPDMFRTWMRILRRVPGSVLWLLADNPWAQENLCDIAASTDIADIADMSVEQITGLSNGVLSGLTSRQMNAMSSDQVQALSNTQVGLIVGKMTEMSDLSLTQVGSLDFTALKGTQVAVLADIQLQALTNTQLLASLTDPAETVLANLGTRVDQLTGGQIAGLGVDVNELTLAQIDELTTSQLRSMGSTQLNALDDAKLQAIDITQLQNTQVAGLTMAKIADAQIGAMTASQIRSLTGTQIAAMSDTQVASISAANAPEMSLSQIGAFSFTQLEDFAPAALAALTADQKDVLASTLTTLQYGTLFP